MEAFARAGPLGEGARACVLANCCRLAFISLQLAHHGPFPSDITTKTEYLVGLPPPLPILPATQFMNLVSLAGQFPTAFHLIGPTAGFNGRLGGAVWP